MAKMTSTARTGWILYMTWSQHYSMEMIPKQASDLLSQIEIYLKLPEHRGTGSENNLQGM